MTRVTRTPVSGTVEPVTEVRMKVALWSLKRFSSFAYIERMRTLFASFIGGYEAHAAAATGPSNSWFRQDLATCYSWLAGIDSGLRRIVNGDRSGYRDVAANLGFRGHFRSRRFEDGDLMIPLGFRDTPPSVGLYAWLERASDMALLVGRTLSSRQAWELLLADPQVSIDPKQLDVAIARRRPFLLASGEPALVTGIWMPSDVTDGCPNFLLDTALAPPALIPYERVDVPAFSAASRARSYYEFHEHPTRWQLLWEDQRYRDGRVPDESEYLGPENEFPNDATTPVPPFVP